MRALAEWWMFECRAQLRQNESQGAVSSREIEKLSPRFRLGQKTDLIRFDRTRHLTPASAE
jgi:hypothetical protein